MPNHIQIKILASHLSFLWVITMCKKIKENPLIPFRDTNEQITLQSN